MAAKFRILINFNMMRTAKLGPNFSAEIEAHQKFYLPRVRLRIMP